MELVIAKTAGFCFGVNNAVNIVYDLATNSEHKIYTLGPIIHNEQVVQKLTEYGVSTINNPEEAEAPAKVVYKKLMV